MTVASKRLHYMDWLRVLAVLLLFPFHTARLFNAGEPFYVKSAATSVWLSAVLGFIDAWHMPLLFLLAGAASCFALHRRTGGQYVGERFKRLLVPLLFGFFVLIPPQTWYGARFNSGYTGGFIEYITSGDFLVWNIRDGGDYFGGFGLGHLWFIEFLFIISLLALPLLLWGRTKKGAAALRNFAVRLAKPVWWVLVAAIILIAEGLPDLEGKNAFVYLAFFCFGYIVMFDESFMTAAERYRWPALALGAAGSMFWVLTGPLRDTLPDPSVQIALLVLVGLLGKWTAIVGLLGAGRRWLDRPSRALSYLAEASYPLYILHQTVIVVVGFYVVRVPVPWFVQLPALLVAAVGATFALYEVVRRVPPLRFLFGMKTARAPMLTPAPSAETA